MHDVDQRRMRITNQSRALAPIYAKAVREENLQDLISVRRQLAEIIEEADKLIVDRIISNLENRLAEDIRDRLRVV